MGGNRGFERAKEERNNLSFYKIFQSADLSSEHMRAFPYNFISKVSQKDFSYKMVIRSQWGSSWKVDVSKNQRFYFMEKRGWDKFVSDNALGENEFITFTHKGKMLFDVNIYEQNGKEMLKPRKLQKFGEVKKEEGDSSSYKGVKKEEETCESPGGVEESKKSKKMKRKKVVNSVEIGEFAEGVERKVKKEEDEESKTFKKKIKRENKNGSPEFSITIRNSYLKFLAMPKHFTKRIPNTSTDFTIHHANGNHSWKVRCLVRENRAILSRGWSKIAREYPLLIGEICTFKLIKPTEFLLTISRKARV